MPGLDGGTAWAWGKLVSSASAWPPGDPLGTVKFLYLDQELVLAADVLDMRRAMNVIAEAQARFAKREARERFVMPLLRTETGCRCRNTFVSMTTTRLRRSRGAG